MEKLVRNEIVDMFQMKIDDAMEGFELCKENIIKEIMGISEGE